jgi:hypothetical protein
MTRIEHPFVKTCRAVFKEKYPDKESAIPEGSPLVDGGIPEDVLTEALRRYYAGKTLVIGPRIQVRPTSAAPKQEVRRTITYA